MGSNQLTGIWNQNPAIATLKVINGATAPIFGPVYTGILRQGFGGAAIDKLNDHLQNQ